MKNQDIKVGMLLRLKRTRAAAYGVSYDGLVKVTAIRANPPYKTPWIMGGLNAYRPSDFERPIDPHAEGCAGGRANAATELKGQIVVGAYGLTDTRFSK